ncbi:MAG: hypothetical protein II703_02050 [Ruminococcus sp.]|nr:hypothetical protein [Ruminococcus sp.]
MTITLNADYFAVCDEKLLGYCGEKDARKMSFTGLDNVEADRYSIIFTYPDGASFESEISDGEITLSNAVMRMSGVILAQVIACITRDDQYIVVKKSNIIQLEIKPSLDEKSPPFPSVDDSLRVLDEIHGTADLLASLSDLLNDRQEHLDGEISQIDSAQQELMTQFGQCIESINDSVDTAAEYALIATENADQIFRNKNDMGADRANIFKPKFTEKEYYGLTVTVNDDTTVTINGMKPGSGYDEISLSGELNPWLDPVPKKHLADGNYILYVEGDFDNDNDCGVSVMKYNRFPDGGFVQEGIAHRWANQSQQAFTIARDQECPYNCIYLYVKQGVQFNNKTAKISIRYPSSGSADTWQPYSPTLQEQIDQLKEQLSGGYNETQSDTITDEVTEVTQ